MNTPKLPRPFVLLALAAALLTGCESTDGPTHVTTNSYYGTGFYPYYYGDYDDDYDVVVNPPPASGVRPPAGGARPSHPIARPPGGGVGARPTPMPSIPSSPRPSARGGRR